MGQPCRVVVSRPIALLGQVAALLVFVLRTFFMSSHVSMIEQSYNGTRHVLLSQFVVTLVIAWLVYRGTNKYREYKVIDCVLFAILSIPTVLLSPHTLQLSDLMI